MDSQAQEGASNIEACRTCNEKCISHTKTATEKQTETKTQPHSQTFLWQPQNQSSHIKRKNKANPTLSAVLN
jgi:hypothetical protein